MTEGDAIRAAEDFGVADGQAVSVQSDGQVTLGHYHSGQTSGDTHVDAWKVTNNGGSYSATKLHSDDKA
jgi:hypothetical protein